MTYDKTQTGWLFINLMLSSLFFLTLAYLKQWGTHPMPFYGFLVAIILLLFVLSIFYRLRIRIDDQAIHLIYGIGLIHKKIKPERVERVRVVRNPWYYGVGIRITPRGMLYSIKGLDAVEIEYFKGIRKRVMIGSDDCQNLKRFIQSKYNVPVSEEDTADYQVG